MYKMIDLEKGLN